MKEQILQLRAEGKTYNEIVAILGCSKSTVSYYCDPNGKEKMLARSRKNQHLKEEFRNRQVQTIRRFTWRHKRINGCIDCGNKDPRVLDYDHVDPSTKIQNVSKLANRGHSLETVKEEIRKCEIRCANCHRIKTMEQFGWWIPE